MEQLREFVYMNTESLNNNLASLGRGIPDEIKHATANETKKGGEGGIKFGSVGVQGESKKSDIEEYETTLDVSAPYRFQELLEIIEGTDIEIKENMEPRSLDRGDIVKIESEVYPMSIFKFQIALEAIMEFTDDKILDAFKKIGTTPPYTDTQVQEFESIRHLIDVFMGKEYPVRIESGEYTYCTMLDKDRMRQNVFDVFESGDRYTIFGRVKRHIPANDEWHPIRAINIIGEYAPDSKKDANDSIIDGLQEFAEETNSEMKPEDLSVRGHTAVIEPIAVYW